MQIHGYGEIIWCREVIFENGKYDRLGRHPGIVLLPTSEKEETAYCLHMTSNKEHIRRNRSKYVECKAAVKKGTHINIGHIIKRNNSMDSAVIDEMSDNEFFILLKNFYDYQMSFSEQSNEFLNIKSKIEILIELLKVNEKLKLEQGKIKYDKLNKYLSISDIKRVSRIYLSELLLKYPYLTEEINKKCFSEEKDRIYVKKILELYEKLKKVEYSKLDLNNPNNQIREIYMNSKQNNYLLNTDILFNDVADLFKVTENDSNYREIISEFIEYEKTRQKQQEIKKEEKFRRRAESKKKTEIENSKNKLEKRRKSLIEKYGEFDWN